MMKRVTMLQNGEVLAKFPSMTHAAMLVEKADRGHISKVVNGYEDRAGGFGWELTDCLDDVGFQSIYQYDLAGNLLAVYTDEFIAAEILGIRVDRLEKVRYNRGNKAKIGEFVFRTHLV